jgi:mono/diheme cytochrome c family protein
MHNQPKFYPQRGTSFFADARSVRPQVNNTVARNQLRETSYFFTGLIDGKEGDALPFPVTRELLARGEERYNVYCTPCHSRVGNGAGMIVQRGYAPAANLQGGRLRAAGLGHFFQVISNGYGAMPDYSAQLSTEERWAVAAYIRALQLSQGAQRSDVPGGKDVKPLTSVAMAEGLPESFAAEWETNASPAASTGTPAPPAPTPKPAGSAPAAPATAASGGKMGAPGTAPAAPPVRVANAKAGLAIYTKNCVVCHTAELTGHPPVFPSLINVVQRVGEAHVRRNVQHGAPPMPAFPGITGTDLDDLVAYLANPAKAGHAPAPKKPDAEAPSN